MRRLVLFVVITVGCQTSGDDSDPTGPPTCAAPSGLYQAQWIRESAEACRLPGEDTLRNFVVDFADQSNLGGRRPLLGGGCPTSEHSVTPDGCEVMFNRSCALDVGPADTRGIIRWKPDMASGAGTVFDSWRSPWSNPTYCSGTFAVTYTRL